MWKLHHWYARLAKGSDGQAVVAAAAVTALTALVLAVGLLVPNVGRFAISAVIFFVVALQALTIFQLGRVHARTNDLQFAIGLEHGLQRSRLSLHDFFYDGAAGTPSLQIYCLKILSFLEPRNVLELGSGQTTRLLSAYARSNERCRVVSLEQSAFWAQQLSPEVAHERHEYIQCGIERRTFTCPGSKLTFEGDWYANVPVSVLGRRYDFILVDGPDDGRKGTEFSPYARAGILWYIPQLLAERFVVLFDDADLYKHQMAIAALKDELAALQIPFISFRVYGVKDQEIVCSPEWKFLRSV